MLVRALIVASWTVSGLFVVDSNKGGHWWRHQNYQTPSSGILCSSSDRTAPKCSPSCRTAVVAPRGQSVLTRMNDSSSAHQPHHDGEDDDDDRGLPHSHDHRNRVVKIDPPNEDDFHETRSSAAAAAPTSSNPAVGLDLTPLCLGSKNQQKKWRKRQAQAEAKRVRKLRERAVKLQAAQAQGRHLPTEEAHQAAVTAAGTSRWRQQRQNLWETERWPLAQVSFQICVDCSFEENMTFREISSLASQLRYCYAANKASPHPCLWTATSLSGQTLQELQKQDIGYPQWSQRGFTGTSQTLQEYYQDRLHKIVYLTSDSEHTLTDLDNDAIYVIGGIVDRNRLQKATLNRAHALNVATAKLPLEQHVLKMPTTRVLTCNHVFALLLQYRQHNGDWGQAFQQVLPRRKEAQFILNNDNKSHADHEPGLIIDTDAEHQ